MQAEGRGLPEPPRQGKAEARIQSINTGAGRLSLSAQPRTPNPAAPLRPQEPRRPLPPTGSWSLSHELPLRRQRQPKALPPDPLLVPASVLAGSPTSLDPQEELE